MRKSRSTTIARGVLLGALVLTALSLVACDGSPPAVTSAWPVANAERTVPKPPEPVRWPYTGNDAPNEKVIKKRPLSVKIENSPSARPQGGLGYADVVYETITEGGITRFNAIFQSNVPDQIVPVRSARFSDLWIVPQYDGLFFFSGASSTVNGRVRAAKLPNLSEDAGISYPYSRATNRSAPHNLILDTDKAYAEAKKRGHSLTANLEPLQYERRSTDGTPTVSEIDIPFSQANRVKWVYNPTTGRYLRWNNGNKHSDATLGKQLAADNVVVMWAKYDAQSRDKVGSTTYDIDLGGEGRVTVFRNGQRFDGTWVAGRNAPPRFKDADGAAIKLARGQTWFQVIPLNGTISMK